VIVSPDGFVITNAHVIGTSRRIQVLLPQKSETPNGSSILKPSGKPVVAEVIGIDRETDVAVLKIPGQNLPYATWGDSESIRQGQIVFAFGSPFGLENSVSMGIVSSVARQVRPEDPMIYIQTDAAINPGNSGGPLVNASGELVGVNTFILTQSGGNDGIGFAIPGNIVRSIYEQIRKYGRVRRGQIGIVVQTITPPLAEALSLPRDWGAIVEDVSPGGSASAAGIEIGDILLRVDGKEIENGRQVGVKVYQSAGRTIEVELLRGDRTLQKRVSVLERPTDPDRLFSAISGPDNLVSKIGVVAVDLDKKVTPILPNLRKLRGAVVAGVVTDLSLDSSNRLQQGDVIYAVNQHPVAGLADLRKAVEPLRHGSPAAIQIERHGQLQFVLLEVD
jgi:serine protease Do